MQRASSRTKAKIEYPKWSVRCEHAHGIALKEAFERLAGEASMLNILRERLAGAENLSESEQRMLWNQYRAVVREKNVGFAERVLNGVYFTSGIRFPFADNPVREEIPFEFWPDLKIFHEDSMVKGRDWNNKVFTYVQVRVSRHFWHSTNYECVTLGHLQFRFNKTQAGIVRLLHEAVEHGETEGLPAKQVLHKVGKRSGDLGDYFKDQEFWRALIMKTTPGRYQLDVYGLWPKYFSLSR